MRNTSKAPKKSRGCLFRLGGAVAGLLVIGAILLIAGYVYETSAEAADVLAYPPPGRLVDVGGFRLHVNCTGSGSPTVVIDAGWGGFSADWSWVQPEVAKTTRICTYDRAGLGWSEAGPAPRDARQLTAELHALLELAGIPGPYVLVGHSLGGLNVRVFAASYPSDVAGLVLIDSMSPDQFTQPPAPPEDPASRAPSLPTVIARFGVARLLTGPAKLPAGVVKAQQAFSVTPRAVQAFVDEGQGLPASAVQARAITALGNLPLIVLSRGLDRDEKWDAMQAGLTGLSSDSRRIFADKSGHDIEFDQPEAATSAILEMVRRLQR